MSNHFNIIEESQLKNDGGITAVGYIVFHANTLTSEYDTITIKLESKEYKFLFDDEVNISGQTIHCRKALLYDSLGEVAAIVNKSKIPFRILCLSNRVYFILKTFADISKCKIETNLGIVSDKPVSVIQFCCQTTEIENGTIVDAYINRVRYYFDDGAEGSKDKGWYKQEYIPTKQLPDPKSFNKFEEEEYIDPTKELIAQALAEHSKTIVEQTVVIPENILDNGHFLIHQRVLNEGVKTVTSLKINEGTHFADRWVLRSYHGTQGKVDMERLQDNGYRFKFEGSDGYFIEQRVRNGSNLFSLDQSYTLGLKVSGITPCIITPTFIAILNKGEDTRVQIIHAESFNISENWQTIYTNVTFNNNLDSMLNDGYTVTHKSIGFSVQGDKPEFIIKDAFLVQGHWNTDKYPEMFFTKNPTTDIINCQRYFQRVIDDCISVTDIGSNGAIKYLCTVQFKTTMIDAPNIRLNQRSTYSNDLTNQPKLNEITPITISPIQSSKNFALNPTSERFHIQGKFGKFGEANALIIFSWEAECSE